MMSKSAKGKHRGNCFIMIQGYKKKKKSLFLPVWITCYKTVKTKGKMKIQFTQFKD